MCVSPVRTDIETAISFGLADVVLPKRAKFAYPWGCKFDRVGVRY